MKNKVPIPIAEINNNGFRPQALRRKNMDIVVAMTLTTP
jgi:hypothetical protein